MRLTRALFSHPRRVRTLRWLACALVGSTLAGWASAQDVELYDRPDFRGARLALDAAAADLGRYGLGDRVSSVVVSRGQWEFCTQPQFRGACITVGPGRYNRLPPALDDKLASLRPADSGRPQPPVPQTRPEPPRGQAGIVLYAGDFSGPELRLFDAVSDLRSRAFNDSATSIDVLHGAWELCSDGGYDGQCLRFGRGRHLLPPALRDRLSSLRPVGDGPSGPPPRDPRDPYRPIGPGVPGGPFGPDGPGRPWSGATPAIVFHEHINFGGRQLPLAGPTPDFGPLGFNDRASSVEVYRGRWQICRHADFQGDCAVFGPGRYTLGGGLQDAVSSARPLFGRGDRHLEPHGGVTLHEQLDLRGHSVFVDGEVRNLRELDFNDRAVAIEVHGGHWELCSASDQRGRCLIFGPGWHRLPEGLAGELSSLRPR